MTGESFRSIAVFGSSEPSPAETLYGAAREVGRLLAVAGHRVVTGGYGGVMEGASRGAAEAGGRALGVVCSAFGDRAPNPYLTEVRNTPDLYARTRELVVASDAFVVLSGGSGTLAEVALVWALHRAGSLGRRPMVLLGDPWPRVLRCLEDAGVLAAPERAMTGLAATPTEAVALVTAALARAGEEG